MVAGDTCRLHRIQNNKKTNITIFIIGGLGNQLFGFSFGKFISILFNKGVIFSDKYVVFGSNNSRIVDIGKFQINDKAFIFKFISQYRKKLILKSKILRRIYWKILEIFTNTITDNNLNYFVMNRRRNYTFRGYFQDWKFADFIGVDYFNEQLKPLKFTSTTQNLLNIQQKVNPILIHLRLGDYLNFPEIYTITPENYFIQALEYFRGVNRKPFWIFCEQLENLEKYYPNLISNAERILIRNKQVDDVNSFYLLSQAKHLVITNSTFSYWAGWIVANNGGSVISIYDHSNAESLANYSKWIKLNMETGEFLTPKNYKPSNKILMQKLNRKYERLFEALNSHS